MSTPPGTERFTVVLTQQDGYRFEADFGNGLPSVTLDEFPPVGTGQGPNPSRLLAAAIGHCLSASLLFCLKKQHIEVGQLRTTVEARLGRNERGRLRVEEVAVLLEPGVGAEVQARMARCAELFEDYCVVTESVRNGIAVQVSLAPATVNPTR